MRLRPNYMEPLCHARICFATRLSLPPARLRSSSCFEQVKRLWPYLASMRGGDEGSVVGFLPPGVDFESHVACDRVIQMPVIAQASRLDRLPVASNFVTIASRRQFQAGRDASR